MIYMIGNSLVEIPCRPVPASYGRSNKSTFSRLPINKLIANHRQGDDRATVKNNNRSTALERPVINNSGGGGGGGGA